MRSLKVLTQAQLIGVVPFKWSGAGAPPQEVGQIVGADLRNSRKFNPIEPSRMPQQPGTASEVIPEAWTALVLTQLLWNKYSLQQMVALLLANS